MSQSVVIIEEPRREWIRQSKVAVSEFRRFSSFRVVVHSPDI